ncbi:uncharacterized protein EI97DRAFT_443735 [Westerdykella ornata]|uniref:F-box domain-containing protein n=1 Tax=Westerdykella ornata TaxID=318751 RepID=A0A6A6JFC8_WESOR|nr:uncharacterized protein EI97DRAFT_443735 [Westerdykella ornata]KAF2274863.1 hypothetical protein EI97DRAFT_443735 [Westerdykella ornata]
MALLELPPEILMQIMDYVGSSYFRQNLGCLTVCKQWFTFARTAYFKDLQLSQNSLQRLMSSHDVERGLPLVRNSLEILDLELKGFEDWRSIPESGSYSQDANVLDAPSWDWDHGLALRLAWTRVLDIDLARLAIIAKESPRLRVFTLEGGARQLSLSNESPLTTSATHSSACWPTEGGFLKLKADIEDQAKAFVAHMASPRFIRILTHTLPQLEMRSFDVLTGKCMRLADNMAWEDDGEIIEEDSDSESEILDDGFSTSSDE